MNEAPYPLNNRLERLISSPDGATAVEYAIQVAGVAILIGLAASTLSTNVSKSLDSIDKAVGDALNESHTVPTPIRKVKKRRSGFQSDRP